MELTKLEKEFGSVEFKGKKYILTQVAYINNAANSGVEYNASAIDEKGNKYLVTWETTADFDESQELHHLEDAIEAEGIDELSEEQQERYQELLDNDVNSGYCEDESNACDWDKPVAVVEA